MYQQLMGLVAVSGGLCQVVAFPINLGRFGNGISLWLGIEPADIFLYVFLPPMLLDAAVRIEYFIFKKVYPLHSPTRHLQH
jgi:hypothetical protein